MHHKAFFSLPVAFTFSLSFAFGAYASEATENDSLFTNQVQELLIGHTQNVNLDSLLLKIEEKVKWGESDSPALIEAQGRIYFVQGEWNKAYIFFQKLKGTSPAILGMIAECTMHKGDKYEAAEWYLKTAQAYLPEESFSTSNFRKYLEIKPNDINVKIMMAKGLEKQNRFVEAGQIYAQEYIFISQNLENTLHAGSLITKSSRPSDAINLYSKARENFPASEEILLALANLYTQINQLPEAASAWEQVFNLNAKNLEARANWLAAIEKIGNPSLSIATLNKVLATQEKSEWHFAWAKLAAQQGHLDTAYTQLHLALKMDPHRSEYLALLPELLQTEQQLQDNLQPLKEFFEQKKNVTPEQLKKMAKAYALNKDMSHSAMLYAEYYRAMPSALDSDDIATQALIEKPDANGEELNVYLVSHCLKTNDTSQAIVLLEKVLSKNPKRSAEQMQLGMLYYAKQDWAKALTHLTPALKSQNNSLAWKALGDIQYSKQHWKEALSAYANTANGDNDLAMARKRLELSKKLNQTTESEKALALIAKLEPDNKATTLALALQQFAKQQYAESAENFSKGLSEDDNQAAHWTDYGLCLLALDKIGEAGPILQKAIDLGDLQNEVMVGRARAYRLEGAKEMSASILNYLMEQNKRNHYALFWSGQFAEQDGNRDQALVLYKEAVQIDPKNPNYSQNLNRLELAGDSQNQK